MDEFFKTRMGVRFFESDVPRISDALAKIASCMVSDREARAKVERPESRGEQIELMLSLDERLTSLIAGVRPTSGLPVELNEAQRDAEAIVAILRRLNA